MRARSCVSLSLLLLILPLGCSTPPDISGELDEYASWLSSVLSLVCNCPEELGYGSQTECADALGFVGNEEQDCLADAASEHEEAVKEHLDCVNVELTTYVECLEANQNCEEGVYSACTMTYQAGKGGCPALPEAIRLEFEMCAG